MYGKVPPSPGAAPRRRAWLLVAVAGAASLVAALAFAAFGPRTSGASADERAFQIVRTDVPVPDVALRGPDGAPFSVTELKGQVVFVNFWATWCPPCREEMPSMLQLGRDMERAHPGKFRLVAVSADENWDEVKKYFQETFGGVPRELTLALDPSAKTALAFYCNARGSCPDVKFPETYVVDKSGRLVAYIVSNRDWSAPAARRFLERLIER